MKMAYLFRVLFRSLIFLPCFASLAMTNFDHTKESSVAAYVKDRLACRIATWQQELAQVKQDIIKNGLTPDLRCSLYRVPFYILFKKDVEVKDLLDNVFLYNQNGKHDVKFFEKDFIKMLKDCSGVTCGRTLYLKKIDDTGYMSEFLHTIEHELTHIEHRYNCDMVLKLNLFSLDGKNKQPALLLRKDAAKLGNCFTSAFLYEKYLKIHYDSGQTVFSFRLNQENKENIDCLDKHGMKRCNRAQEYEADLMGLKFHPQCKDLKHFCINGKHQYMPNEEAGYMSFKERIEHIDIILKNKTPIKGSILSVLQEKNE